MIAQELEVSLHMAFVEARQKRHEFITVEHLLLALLDNPSAAEVLRACAADIEGLRKDLNAKGLEIDEGTLYPLLRRLEARGLLKSEWRIDESRKKRHYRISALGEEVLASLVTEWRLLNESVDKILKEKDA